MVAFERRDFDRSLPPVTPENIVVKPGISIYPVSEEVGFLIDEKDLTTDDFIESEVLKIAELAQRTREVVEHQGGVFNGLIERNVERTDQEWMGSPVSVKVIYALVYKPY